MSACWWAQEIPLASRCCLGDGTDVLDLRNIEKHDTERIRSWLYQASAEGGEWEIWMERGHPDVVEHIYAVAEDVRAVRGLRRIWIRWQKRQESPSVKEVVAYLQYHMAMDQYRLPEDIQLIVEEEEEEEEELKQ